MTGPSPPERRQLTVLVCDLVGWSALSSRLDAEELAELVHAYRQRCTSLVARHGGMVAQFVGDGVVAYFGYPRAHEDDAERAVRAALDIAASGAPSPQLPGVRIGVATGTVVVGNLSGQEGRPAGGSAAEVMAEISAVGTAPNLAARLQTLAAPGGVVVSEQTLRLTRGLFQYQDLGRRPLKGFGDAVRAWAVVRERSVKSRFHALRARSLTPLVNRQLELRELAALWESARGGHGGAVLLTSEPGMGKSRLAHEVARRIVDRRCLRLWYYCAPHLQSSPLAPLIRQLSLAARFTDRDSDETKLGKLAAIPAGMQAAGTSDTIPLLASLLSIRYEDEYPPLNMSPQRQKLRLFEELGRLLEVAAARRPVLLVIEDLHWIDPSSDELIGILIDRLPRLPALAIITARTEFQSHWNDRPHLVHMRLGALVRDDAITLIHSLCGEQRMPEGTIAQIADRADGLPLFIEDLTRDFLETATLPTPDGTVAGPDRPPAVIPATLTDSLMSRLDRLGPAKAVAQTAAALGREFSFQVLAAVAGRPAEELKEQIYRLVEAGLLVIRPSTTVLVYAFKHALVRDAAYSSLLRKEQTALHARIASTLLEDFSETAESQPEVVAYHFQAAGDVEHAVQYLVKAAKLSATRSGFVEAIAHLQGALGLLGAQGRSRERLRLELRVQLALGGIYAEYRGFSSSACGQAYAAALDLCRELGDAPEIFSVLSGVGSFEITRANLPRCRALAEECLLRAAQQQTKPPFIMGHLLLGGTLFLSAELAAAREHLEQALLLYEEDRDSRRRRQVLYVQDQKSTGLCYLALTLTLLGHLDRGLEAAQAGLRHSETLGGLHTVNFSRCYLAGVHLFRGEPHEALHHATESLDLAREQGYATWVGASQMIRGDALIAAGRFAEGFECIVAGIRAHSGMGAVTYQPFGLSAYAKALATAGRLDDALHALAQALDIIERTGERFYLAELLRIQGEVLARQGQPREAEHRLRESVRVAHQQEARLFELRSGIALSRLLGGSERERAIRDVLLPVCRWFPPDADGPDLRAARALLASGTPIG